MDEIQALTTERVINAFRQAQISSIDLMGSTGYGYQDRGRERLDQVFARVFGTEAALVRPQWVSGTHALATALKAVAGAGHIIWIPTGTPYDTISPTLQRLRSKGTGVVLVDPLEDGNPDFAQMRPTPGDIIYIQRSRGYAKRRAWGRPQIEPLARWAHQHGAQVLVDNCYGEFTRTEEPGHWGADLVVGSLMKNPGGAIAPTGAYVAGTSDWVGRVAEELFAPGIAGEVGATSPYLRLIAQGLFLAPQMVAEALKGGLYASWAAENRGILSYPAARDHDRNDIVVALHLETSARIIAFCQVLQSWEPIDAFLNPEPWDMPGYEHPIIMAAGGFVSGGSLELSCDAPIRPPYHVYLQGGVNRWHTKLAVDAALDAIPS